MALNLGGSTINVGWIRHAVCAVIHRTCRQALIKKGLVLLRNAWWITQKTLIHPTFRLKSVPFSLRTVYSLSLAKY